MSAREARSVARKRRWAVQALALLGSLAAVAVLSGWTGRTALGKAAAAGGGIHFTDVTGKAGIHFTHNSGRAGKKYLPETLGPGCAFFDADGDGWPDILIVNGRDWIFLIQFNQKHIHSLLVSRACIVGPLSLGSCSKRSSPV